MASRPPPVSTIFAQGSCYRHNICRSTWTAKWLKEIAPKITHPIDRPQWINFASFLETADYFQEITPDCLKAFIQSFLTEGIPIGVDGIIRESVKNIVEHYRSL
jgi:hypothetical protein